jgi:hypothetical protein
MAMGKRILLVAAVVLVGLALWRLALDQNPVAEEPQPAEPSAPPASEPQRDPNAVTERATPPGTSDSKQDSKAETQTAPASPSEAPAAPQQPEDPAPIPAPQASGPIAELKQAFEKEPRDSAAQVPESRIQSEFKKSDIAPGLLKSVLCRKSVCKVETLWTPERATAFMAAFTRLSAEFEPNIALDPHNKPVAQQELQVDVYLPRLGAGTKPAER